MVYCLFNSSNPDFGLLRNLDPDNSTPKAVLLKNFANLVSFGNDVNNPANFTNTAPFTPAYTGAGLLVSGLPARALDHDRGLA